MLSVRVNVPATACGRRAGLAAPTMIASFRKSGVARTRSVRVHASCQADAVGPLDISRRHLLVTVPAAVVLSRMLPAAAGDGYRTFLGFNQAPDLYLGYGQASDAPPMYSFEYPVDWEEEAVSKTQKSTMGMDGMVLHPKTKKEQAYVIALGGKDYRDSVLKDAKTSLIVVAGGDPDLRQALTDGEVKQAQKTINGTPMYVYEVTSDRRKYLSTIGKKGDTVYGLVVGAPLTAFERDADQLRHIQDTFKLL